MSIMDKVREKLAGGGRTPEPTKGAGIILQWFRERYRPAFRRGLAIVTDDGATVKRAEACDVPNSELIARLATAEDAPTEKSGAVKSDQLPGFFRKWGPVAWGDLLDSLPEEDAANLGSDSAAGEEFRRLVKAAMLTPLQLGDTGRGDDVSRVERRSLIDWCKKFAKPGPWRSIRSFRCWCRCKVTPGAEIILEVAIRHELFSQLHANSRLCDLNGNTFARRAAKYGVGSTSRADRPHGLSAVLLDFAFIRELTDTITDDDAEDGEI